MSILCPNCQYENPEKTNFCGKCATPLPAHEKDSLHPTQTFAHAKDQLTTGTTFARRYTIIEELGQGGMGKVYKADDTELREKVALKLINPEIASNPKTIERFRNELKLARKIRHKNVCQMFDLNKDQDHYFISMEYVPGEDLKSFMRRSKQLATPTAVSIAVQVCDGLSEAHKHGVIHRDLKPSNIMIDREGNVRILDFGIARSLTSRGITASGVMIGTADYMSPEQTDGRGIDERSDLYSLGVILYELVTGRPPFEGDTPLSIAMKHKTAVPPDPRRWNSHLLEELSRIILRCLEKDKANRYQTAESLKQALMGVDGGAAAGAESIVPKKRPATSRDITVSFNLKKLLAPVGAVAAAVLLIVVGSKFLARPGPALIASDEPSLGVLFFENYSGDTNLDYLRVAFQELMITDLAQSQHIRVLRLDEMNSVLQGLSLADAQSYSLEDIQGMARRNGIDYVVRGSYIKTGDNFRITATLIDARNGETLLSLSAQADGQQDLSTKVDDLAREMRAEVDIAPEEAAVEQALEDLIISTDLESPPAQEPPIKKESPGVPDPPVKK